MLTCVFHHFWLDGGYSQVGQVFCNCLICLARMAGKRHSALIHSLCLIHLRNEKSCFMLHLCSGMFLVHLFLPHWRLIGASPPLCLCCSYPGKIERSFVQHLNFRLSSCLLDLYEALGFIVSAFCDRAAWLPLQLATPEQGCSYAFVCVRG